MAIQIADGSTSYLEQASAAGAAASGGYMDSIWINDPTTLDACAVIVSSADNTTATHYNAIITSAAAANTIARSTDTTNANGGFLFTRTAGVWEHVAASFLSASSRSIYHQGVLGVTNTTAKTQNAFGYTKLGALPDDTNAYTNKCAAELSRWDISGFSQANCDALAARLATLSGGDIVDPRIVNAEVGEVWEGRLIRYWKFETNADLADYLESENDFTAYGTVSNYTHPDVIAWASPEITSVTSPYVEGSTITVSGTGFNLLGTGIGGIKLLNVAGGTTQTVTDETDPANIEVTAAVGAGLYGPNGSCTLQVTTEQGQTATFDGIEVIPANPDPATTTGERYIDISVTPPVDDTIRFSSTPDIAVGSQVHYKTLLNASAVGQDIDLLDAQPDGSVSVSSTVTLPATVLYRVNNDDGEGWSAFATLTLDEAAGDNPSLIGDDEVFIVPEILQTVSADLSELVSPGTWAWTIASGTLPAWASLGASTGIISGVANAYGTTTVTVRVTGDSTFIDLTVEIDVTRNPATDNIQGKKQGRYRAAAATASGFNSDWIAAMRADLVDDSGSINELAIRWLQQKLSSSTTSLPSLLAEAAADRGVSRWQEIDNPTAIGT